ncbi:Ldh family oxidoreductase [Marinobacter sp. SS21]|uniref:Ldh family oxidoreductase n=1 Tax=Marinobacter sp. SS21 TaxID=2979460 RepID=UPI00232B3264|nr:Ldh family oxidoreductase [Marinobacter sp. SS21]MDC0663125.1 Ldh family oxidoreductase [Marinobacter sp. SS21]
MITNQEVLQQLAKTLLVQAGAAPDEAATVARVLAWADAAGRPNQGVWRLPTLCQRLRQGLYASPCKPTFERVSAAIGRLDGGNGLGHFVGHEAMVRAVEMARAEGVGIVLVRRSNYLGPTGYYAQMAASEGMLGIALSNSFPKVKACRGEAAVLGTNPLAFACPALDGAPLIVDMATSEQAGSTLRRQAEKAPGEQTQTSILAPFGGAKGYAVGLVVEILSGVLSGAGFSHQVRSMYKDFEQPGNNGHFFCVIDIARLMPLEAFVGRMELLVEWLRQSGEAVLYPGEQRAATLRQSQQQGIQVDDDVWSSLQVLKRAG